MPHTVRNKAKLLARIRRLQGQIEGLAKAVEEEQGCTPVLHLIAACRGAISGLMFEVLEGHVREHVMDTSHSPTSDQSEAAEELIDVLKTYLK
jgi:FrmR/RcnR family transcriptional regulator, repressor of frmRAB operon